MVVAVGQDFSKTFPRLVGHNSGGGSVARLFQDFSKTFQDVPQDFFQDFFPDSLRLVQD